MFMKIRLFLIKTLLGKKGLIANIEIDGTSPISREDRFLFVGGSDLWINENGLELMNVKTLKNNEINDFKFTNRTKFFWRKSKNYMRTELIERYGDDDVREAWIKEEQRFKTHAELLGLTEEEYQKWYDENLLPY